jgi:hypothetical protein
MTEYALGATANCTDGLCGVVSRTILDPAARAVTHLVIVPRHHHAEGRLVPVELVEATAGEIRLRCTLAEFARLDSAEEVEVIGDDGYGGGYGQAGAVQGYGNVGGMGVGGSASGVGIGASLGHHVPVVVSHAIPLGETEVGRHECVHAVDGEIGKVEGFIVSPADHQVTHVLLQEGHLWGRRQVAIPVSAVASLDAGIRLNITKKQVEDLPPAEAITRHE